MRTNILDHVTYATAWPFVRAHFIKRVVVDGEAVDVPKEQAFNSPGVMDAIAALETAILAELGSVTLEAGTVETGGSTEALSAPKQITAEATTMRALHAERDRSAAREAVKKLAAEWDAANPSPSAEYDENGVRVDAPPEIRGAAGDNTARPGIVPKRNG